MTREPFTLICGAAVIQVIAKIDHHAPPTDHQGPVQIEFGGCAYNTAVNLGSLGTKSVFLSAMNTGPFSQLILNQLKREQVRTYIKEVSGLGDAAHTSIVENGETSLAVSSKVHDAIDLEVEDFSSVLRDAHCAVITCDFSQHTLNVFNREAEKHDIAVVMVGVSKQCAKKIKQSAKAPYYFVTKDVMNELALTTNNSNNWGMLAHEWNASFMVFMGKKGIALYTPLGGEVLTSDSIAVTGNTLGASDLMLSGLIHYHLFEDYELRAAVELSFGHMETILTRDHTNLSAGNSMEHNIQSVFNDAHRDKLTGILNRTGLESFYESCATGSDMFYLMIVDVDHFKSINDNYGHPIGDKVLVGLTSSLQKSMRDGDIVARWGGEEFVCLFQASSPEEANQFAERIRLSIENAKINGFDGTITISGGVSKINPSDSLVSTVETADRLLYQAKQSGRNKVITESIC